METAKNKTESWLDALWEKERARGFKIPQRQLNAKMQQLEELATSFIAKRNQMDADYHAQSREIIELHTITIDGKRYELVD